METTFQHFVLIYRNFSLVPFSAGIVAGRELLNEAWQIQVSGSLTKSTQTSLERMCVLVRGLHLHALPLRRKSQCAVHSQKTETWATARLWGQRTNRLRGILSCERFATSLFGKTSLFDSLTREF